MHGGHYSTEVTEPRMKISELLKSEISNSIKDYCANIRRCDPRSTVEFLISSNGGAIQYVKSWLSFFSSPENPLILEIGSGLGFGLTTMLLAGVDVIGVEPGNTVGFEGRYSYASRLLVENGISNYKSRLFDAKAEKLPFSDNYFDVVYSIAVLEHVSDVKKGLEESVRVAKPGAVILHNLPNYNSFYEGHYDIMWLPFVLRTRFAAKFWVRLFGRKDYFIDELNFVTPNNIRAHLANMNGIKYYLFFTFRHEWINNISYAWRNNILVQKHNGLKNRLRGAFLMTLVFLGLSHIFDLIIIKQK
jgi:SAM-dependent methyltransferase